MEDKHFALLIDSDNISSKYISTIIDEMTKYGTVTYKRIYGDWTTPQSAKWKKELIANSITPIQQFRYTVGKNATDSTLIIDAMDILYTGNVDGFCIVSSDSDFTRLAARLRESGMDVIGMGEHKTPRSFRAACSVFTSLEILLEQCEEEGSAEPDFSREPEEKIKSGDDTGAFAVPDDETAYGDYSDERNGDVIHQSTVENAIIQIITENDDKGHITELSEIGNRLQKKYSDFDVRNYGYSSLSQFIADSVEFEMDRINTKCVIRLKKDDDFKQKVIEFMIQCVKEGPPEGVDVGFVGQKLHQRYPSFSVKSLGYSTLSKFASVIRQLQVHVDDAGRKILTLK